MTQCHVKIKIVAYTVEFHLPIFLNFLLFDIDTTMLASYYLQRSRCSVEPTLMNLLCQRRFFIVDNEMFNIEYPHLTTTYLPRAAGVHVCYPITLIKYQSRM